ncbi:N-acetyl-gamma-glutamyl-phosphate reductase [Aliidiomarina maris]|uniref:N-acetyl-gamma-glutamyl-phosphate reductase n=1 Tax=Aliidiomarina maris TaxID=531312 RepID=A0A327X2M3_9GAMM|nr:N-acetyl-gamma-glutamyl-phosphate reductase [Aliidiomarina maris]RAJ98882.1 N-acetyl-gamma-glutamyl-phosphate reductase [Aliidiomarina maris]RUO25028.1 N-acetyl-gamma-glutamyl-phosphate reductase [Aliidiomarina maris]
MKAEKTVWILGASGYSGAELCRLVSRHPHMQLARAFAFSAQNAMPLPELFPHLSMQVDIQLQQWQDEVLDEAAGVDIVFLALPHEASLELAPKFLAAGCCVVDLSAAFRLRDLNNYPTFYGFTHTHPEWLQQRSYALPHALPVPKHDKKEQAIAAIQAHQLLSMPGCYPTAASLALAPLLLNKLLDTTQTPVISAVSGVSGAGRKASLATSFCEVSLRPYGVLEHRHQCEIAQNLGLEVMFIPQLGNFKRGIVATCAARVQAGVSPAQVQAAFESAYQNNPSIRLRNQPPQADDVAHTPFCDLFIKVQGQHVVVISAIDNLLKGAASQAIEACNVKFGWPQMEALL